MTTSSKSASEQEWPVEARDAGEATETWARETRPLAAITNTAVGDTVVANTTARGAADAPAPADAVEDVVEDVVEDITADVDAALPADVPAAPPARKATLMSAIDRAGSGGDLKGPGNSTPPARDPAQNGAPAMGGAAASGGVADTGTALPLSLTDEIPDEADEWSTADQPTVVLSPRAFQRRKPGYLDTGEQHSWPPAGGTNAGASSGPNARQTTPRLGTLGSVTAATPTPPSTKPERLAGLNGPRLAAPDGRRADVTPPTGVPRSALSNPRMHRFQELRRRRAAHEQGERGPDEGRPVAELVRQWWGDLRPGLARALDYQHEARASGTHPIPAHEPAPASRLGDAFGYVARSARDIAERASNAAAPHLKRMHDQAEHVAQALIERFEGNSARQQGPLLGPGRIAVFFRPAVTVGQAQRLLSATQARPMRIIPRKHGFLALVRPGTEAEVSERLRQHPYVQDVVYLEYDEYGDPVESEKPAELEES